MTNASIARTVRQLKRVSDVFILGAENIAPLTVLVFFDDGSSDTFTANEKAGTRSSNLELLVRQIEVRTENWT